MKNALLWLGFVAVLSGCTYLQVCRGGIKPEYDFETAWIKFSRNHSDTSRCGNY